MENTTSGETPSTVAAPRVLDRKGFVYTPAISPRLKYLLALIFLGFALLGATGLYLSSISLFNYFAAPQDYTSRFSLWVILVHTFFGALLVLPFVYFGVVHWISARHRKNRRAIRLGILLFFVGILVCLSGLALMQVHDSIQLPTGTWTRSVIYWLHIVAPVLAVGIYVLHRRAGPDIQWKWGAAWGGGVGLFIVTMLVLQYQDPRQWYLSAPKEGEQYFHPSSARTVGGTFVSAETFMMDEYCMKCHQDIYKDHLHSAHRFSSFNNPAYLLSVRETREKAGIQASRWCAGCHDPVPFFSGKFDNPNYDDVNDPTAHAGITCTVCHAMTHVNSVKGNADYVIEEPEHYPFAFSKNSLLQWVNERMVKAKPDFHKKTFLKDFHKSAEFCSTCHKVSLPIELNQYKEFLRGQDHYNTYLLSGVSGVGTRSFYYPEKAKTNCAECHMPLERSTDFGSRDFDGSGERKRHSHFFPAANTGLPWLLHQQPQRSDSEKEALRGFIRKNAEFLRGTDPKAPPVTAAGPKMRIDLFGLKQDGKIDGALTKLRPELPTLEPGKTYLVEVVVRTLGVGHPFTQGTVDSNEVWVDLEARHGDRVIGKNGGLENRQGLKGESAFPEPSLPYVRLDDRPVDPWAHFINVHMLDRHGNRINRRNPQDIFTPLYNNQIPPGAGQVVHYSLTVPERDRLALDPNGKPAPLTLKVRLRYRKFDYEYMSLVHGNARKVRSPSGQEHIIPGDENHKVPQTPVVDLCEDEVTLAVAGGAPVAAQQSPITPEWQRWNDYGIGLFLRAEMFGKKPGLRQAEEAFQVLVNHKEAVPKVHGLLNLGRVYALEGGERLKDAVKALEAVEALRKEGAPVPWWTAAWLSARVNLLNENVDAAIRDLEKVLAPEHQETARKFDFRRDFVIINLLAQAYYEKSKFYLEEPTQRDRWLLKAIARYEQTLELDPEDTEAHGGLQECYRQLGSGLTPPNVTLKPDELTTWGKVFADESQPSSERLVAAQRLVGGLPSLASQSFTRATKRPALEELQQRIRPVFRQTSDSALREAAAAILGQTHSQLYAIFKVDDAAEARSKTIYREHHEAPRHASQEAIVIYPLQRPGAPGLR